MIKKIYCVILLHTVAFSSLPAMDYTQKALSRALHLIKQFSGPQQMNGLTQKNPQLPIQITGKHKYLFDLFSFWHNK